MVELNVPIGSRTLAIRLGELIAEARRLAGWSQRELAHRAATSQSEVSRIERGAATSLDLLVVERLLHALGLRATLAIEGRHLQDRRRQAEPVHARLNGFVAGHLRRRSWLTALEAQIGEPVPRGWIDVVAYRPTDRALIVDETKGDLPDVGAFQRSLAFYERSALDVAHRLGWRPTRVVVLATLLDSETVAGRVRDNRQLLAQAFPSPVDRFLRWVDDPSAPAPHGWTLAMADPASRAAAWLRPTALEGRRKVPAYSSYADAAARLRAGRRRSHG